MFGTSVAGAGDTNRDGYADAIVGAPRESTNSLTENGIAVVIRGRSTGMIDVTLRLHGSWSSGRFGGAVAGVGDVNGDGFADVAVAAPAVNSYTGSVHVYTGNAIGFTDTGRLTGANTNDVFGAALAGAGDVDNDGFTDFVIGAPAASPRGQTQAGAASVYRGNAAGLFSIAARTIEGAAAGDRLGNFAAGGGDINNDGFADIVVSSPYASPPGRALQGSVGVFYGAPAGIGGTPASTLVGAAAGDRFGFAVASHADVNGDGFDDLIIGAPDAAPGGRLSAGIVTVFHGSMTGIATAPARSLEGASAGDLFGHSVASALQHRRSSAARPRECVSFSSVHRER